MRKDSPLFPQALFVQDILVRGDWRRSSRRRSLIQRCDRGHYASAISTLIHKFAQVFCAIPVDGIFMEVYLDARLNRKQKDFAVQFRDT
jgi:hypothetical protein